MHREDFNNMGPLLKRLKDSRLHSRDTFKDLPQQGVNVFYDDVSHNYPVSGIRQLIPFSMGDSVNYSHT